MRIISLVVAVFSSAFVPFIRGSSTTGQTLGKSSADTQKLILFGARFSTTLM